jgi:acyl-coenzyme A thioesterase PaaI-like protein
VLHPGRRAATAEGRLLDGAGRLLAHGTTTCIILPASAGVSRS